MYPYLYENTIRVPAAHGCVSLLEHFAQAVEGELGPQENPVRFAVTASYTDGFDCEIGTLVDPDAPRLQSVFEFTHRRVENTQSFNVVLLVPTGIGCEIGGHAGDAAPVATLLASVSDTLVTHPNVVNASDVIEIPGNALYVEGNVVSRLLMGTVGLQRTRGNRLLVVIDEHNDPTFTEAAINSVSAARVSYGLAGAEVVTLHPPIRMEAKFAPSGRAAGTVEGLDALWDVLDRRCGTYDAVALSSVIRVPYSYHKEYFEQEGAMVNPWGGVEAMLTHAISQRCNVPSAHSPMLESKEVANFEPGIIDPRMAAEAVSLTYMQCILKGLRHSPRIVTDPEAMNHHSVFTAADVSCLVIPDGCLGLPTLAALEQGIPVIAVRENRNVMRNDLSMLPWAEGQLHTVDNYWEAAGVLSALRAGVDPAAVRRPLARTRVTDATGRVRPDVRAVEQSVPTSADRQHEADTIPRV